MTKTKRPEIISRLSFYLMDKEPLIYLFIINSDFIKDEWGILKQGENEGFAGVAYKNNRVKFLYTDSFLNLPLKQLYFVLIHEAQHVFKSHVKGIHKDLKNFKLVNIAEDSIINEEILEMKFVGISPEKPLDSIFTIPLEFKNHFYNLGKSAYTTPRLYNWYIEKEKKEKEENKESFLMKNRYAKKKDEDGNEVYGRVLYKKADNEKIVLESYESKEDMLNQMKGDKFKVKGYEEEDSNDLTPVIFTNDDHSFSSGFENTYNAEVIGYFDKKINDAKEFDDEEEDIIPQNIFIENIVKQAESMIESNQSLQEARKTAGIKEGNSLMYAVKELLKSEVSWKKEFRQGLNIYLSDRGHSVGNKKSYITSLMNPRTRYGILGKHNLKTIKKEQNYILLAVDTSGSCFYDEHDKKRFFTEIDEISKEMEFNNAGKVFIFMWYWMVLNREMIEYKTGDWKKFNLRGGGGTNPEVVFNFLKEISEEKGNSLIMNINKKEKIFIKDKKKLPFLLVMTDGYFYRGLTGDSLGIYEKDKDSLMFLTKTSSRVPSGIKAIEYR